jgi:hypothetical protein
MHVAVLLFMFQMICWSRFVSVKINFSRRSCQLLLEGYHCFLLITSRPSSSSASSHLQLLKTETHREIHRIISLVRMYKKKSINAKYKIREVSTGPRAWPQPEKDDTLLGNTVFCTLNQPVNWKYTGPFPIKDSRVKYPRSTKCYRLSRDVKIRIESLSHGAYRNSMEIAKTPT